MSHNFKPGDLAITLKSGYGIAAMAMVQLEMFLGKGKRAEEPDGKLWTAPFDGWVVGRDGEDGFGFFKASKLMPLRGDFQPDQQKTKEAEPCA